jgi:hypothetical protein
VFQVTWTEIEKLHKGDSFFNALYVGADARRAQETLARLALLPGARKLAHAYDWGDGPAGAATVAEEASLNADSPDECTVVIYEPDRALSEQEFLRGLPSIDLVGAVSEQVVGIISTPSASLTLGKFARLIAKNFAWVGNVDPADVVAGWRRSPCSSAQGLDLTRAGRKRPSDWLGTFAHDYLLNGVLSLNLRSVIDDAGLPVEPKDIDLLYCLVAKILLNPIPPGVVGRDRARYFRPRSAGDFTELERRLSPARTRFFVPANLHAEFESAVAAEKLTTTISVSSWREPGDLKLVVGRAREEGVASIIWSDPTEWESYSGDFVSKPLPAVVLIADSEFCTGWDDWRRMLARNVVGSITPDDLRQFISNRYVVLRAFAMQSMRTSLAQVFEKVVDMYQRLASLADWGSLSEQKDFYVRKLYGCAANLQFAQELYFADGPNTPGDNQ